MRRNFKVWGRMVHSTPIILRLFLWMPRSTSTSQLLLEVVCLNLYQVPRAANIYWKLDHGYRLTLESKSSDGAIGTRKCPLSWVCFSIPSQTSSNTHQLTKKPKTPNL